MQAKKQRESQAVTSCPRILTSPASRGGRGAAEHDAQGLTLAMELLSLEALSSRLATRIKPSNIRPSQRLQT